MPLAVRSVGSDCALAALALPLGCAVASHAGAAVTIAALEDGKANVWIDTQQNKVTGSTPLAGGASLVGIDVRPADGELIRNDGGRHHRHAQFDVGLGALVKQAPPNDGTLNTIAQLGVKFTGPVAFDIVSDGKGGKTGWLLVDGRLFTVDLASGMAKSAGRSAGLKGPISDIAVLPMNEKATAGHPACRRFLTQTAWRSRAVTRRWVGA